MYSKDLTGLMLDQDLSSADNSSSNQQSPRKSAKTLHQPDDSHLFKPPAAKTTSSKTLDKVVLSLKRTAGDWNVTNKKITEYFPAAAVVDTSLEEKSTRPEVDSSGTPPKSRRGRKPKSVKQVVVSPPKDNIVQAQSPFEPRASKRLAAQSKKTETESPFENRFVLLTSDQLSEAFKKLSQQF